MKLQRQHFLLSYLKTLSVGPVGVSNSRPSASQPGAQPSELSVRGDLGTCGGYIHAIFAYLGALEYYILYVAKIDCPSFSTLIFEEFANSANTYSML